MSDDNFGPWIDWAGGECPIPEAKAGEYDLKFADGNSSSVVTKIAASMWNWREGDVMIPIIAYRVRLREACGNDPTVLRGFVEIDEMYVGGKEANKHKGKKLNAGRGAVGKTAAINLRQALATGENR